MKTNSPILFAVSVLAVLAYVSCSTKPAPPPAGESSSLTSYEHGVPGGVMVDTYKVTATVKSVDHEKRQATLLTSDGEETVYKAGPEVINFDQVRVGDHVKATVTEQLVVYVREKGEVRSDGQATTIALAPKGAKPGVVMADTVEVTARVKSVDLKKHRATLELPDGRTKKVSVRPDVKLSADDVGREVVIRASQALAVRVETP